MSNLYVRNIKPQSQTQMSVKKQAVKQRRIAHARWLSWWEHHPGTKRLWI